MSIWETAGASDEWYTPRYVFDALDETFDMDVAAPADMRHISTPAKAFLRSDSLALDWHGFVWMNPPFGGRNGIKPWLDKFFEHGNGIALTPDRTSAPWWQEAARKASGVLFVSPKIRFIRPDGSEGRSPGNGTSLFAAGVRARKALVVAEGAGLGVMPK